MPGEDRMQDVLSEEIQESVLTEGAVRSEKKLSLLKLRRYDSLDIE